MENITKKIQEAIDLSQYVSGQGCEYTTCVQNEVIEVPVTDDITKYDAEDYRDTAEYWLESSEGDEDKYFKFTIRLYEENADQMVDEPIKTIEFWAEWEDGELKIEED